MKHPTCKAASDLLEERARLLSVNDSDAFQICDKPGNLDYQDLRGTDWTTARPVAVASRVIKLVEGGYLPPEDTDRLCTDALKAAGEAVIEAAIYNGCIQVSSETVRDYCDDYCKSEIADAKDTWDSNHNEEIEELEDRIASRDTLIQEKDDQLIECEEKQEILDRRRELPHTPSLPVLVRTRSRR